MTRAGGCRDEKTTHAAYGTIQHWSISATCFSQWFVGMGLPCPGKGVGSPNPHDAYHLKHRSVEALRSLVSPHPYVQLLAVAVAGAGRYKSLAVLTKAPVRSSHDHGPFTVKPAAAVAEGAHQFSFQLWSM